MQKNKNSFDKLFELIKLEKKEISAIYFYAILSGLIQLSLPLGIQAILGFVMGATMVTSVYVLVSIIIMSVLVVGYMQINQMKIIEKIQQKIFVRYAFLYAETIPKFDLKFIDNYYLPEKINRFFDAVNIQKGVSKILLDIPVATIQILFGLILLALYHPLFIVFSLTLTLIVVLIFRFTSAWGLETSIEESERKYKVVAWLQEIGRVIKSFKYTQGTDIALEKSDTKLLHYINARTKHFKVLLLQFKSLVLFKVLTTAMILILGTYLLFEQQINIGQFVAAEIVIINIINSLEKLIMSLENIYDVITGFKKLESVLENKLETDGSIELNQNEIELELNHVGFSYSESQKIFQSLSFSIPKNSITAISGRENSGKSTLLKLLSGAYKKFDGTIKLNGIPLENYLIKSIREKTGVLLYEQEIFEGTLYENITLGRKNISINEIIFLTQSLGFDDFVAFFKKSFQTEILPFGKNLPLSIRMKILLLRALANNPNYLILENPWNGLDEKTTISVQNYLLQLAKSKTIIVSTNDKNFISKCSHHIYLENGNVTIKE
jgi:ATP-binding cassette, subfamily B, bacterial